MHPSLIFRPGALLSQSELSAARLDGLLIEIGDAYMTPDLPEDAPARLASIAHVIAPGYAACGPSAAWAHGAGNAPPRCHHIQRVVAYRPRTAPARDVAVHDRRLDVDDVELIGGAPVTTAVRTMTDLILGVSRDAEVTWWAQRLAEVFPDSPRGARERLLARGRMPGKRRALALIDELFGEDPADYEEVTR